MGSDSLLIFGDLEANHDVHCKTCGSLLYSVLQHGTRVHVAMGSLIDEPSVSPTAHIFVSEKASWHQITDALPQYEGYAT